jgi:hypothetical protein
MQAWVGLLIVVAAVASRPIEVRMWRAGRLSDRTLAVLLLGRSPVLIALFSLLIGGPPMVILFMVAISLVPGVFLYRWLLGIIQGQARELRKTE